MTASQIIRTRRALLNKELDAMRAYCDACVMFRNGVRNGDTSVLEHKNAISGFLDYAHACTNAVLDFERMYVAG